MKAWRNGFLSETFRFIDNGRFDQNDYLTDYEWYFKANYVNEKKMSYVLDNKLYFYYFIKAFYGGDPTARIFPLHHGVWTRRHFHPIDKRGSAASLDGLLELCKSYGTIVIKPAVGCCGRGVMFLRYADGGFSLNGARLAGARDLLRRLERNPVPHVVTEFIEQTGYAERIHPGSVNTIRLITLWDDAAGAPFVARAMHRFGTSRSAPVDNRSRGGASALIDCRTGRLGDLLAQSRDGGWTLHSDHPETGQAVRNVEIPLWDELCRSVLFLSGQIPLVPMIGWDVAVTAGGFWIIEANSQPGLMQHHAPLLEDPRAKRFFAERAGIRRRKWRKRHARSAGGGLEFSGSGRL